MRVSASSLPTRRQFPSSHKYDRTRHGIQNLKRPEVISDPLVYVDSIAELGPLFFDDTVHAWICSGYDESTVILKDYRRFSSARLRTPESLNRRRLHSAATISELLSEQILFSDPPKSTELMSMFRDQFRASRVAERDEVLRDMVDGVLETLPKAGTFDLIADFAARLHPLLIGYLLGMAGKSEEITQWALAYSRVIGGLSSLPGPGDDETIPVLEGAMITFREAARSRIESPGDDLISSMVSGIRDLDVMPDAMLRSIAANCIVLAGGGYQTLTHLVSTGLLLLDANPEQERMLRANSDLIGPAIDEFMRISGSSQYVGRRATVDVEIAGARMHAGDPVLVLLPAANLDPRKFENPRALDICRSGSKHLGFGLGRHYCVGAPYAERMARWAILGFLERYPDYAVGRGRNGLTWSPQPNIRCLAHASVQVGLEVRASEPGAAPEPASRPADSVLSEADWQRVMVEWNGTESPASAFECWHHLFAHQARVAPDLIAIDEGDATYTYRDIEQRANALAIALQSSYGVMPGSVVGVVMNRSAPFVITVLGIAKAGGTFMLADVGCPGKRLRGMVKDAAIGLILTDETTLGKLDSSELSTRVVIVDASSTAEKGPVTGVCARDTAYVVFTSGTAGQPKAIAVDHEAVVNLHVAQRQVFQIRSGERILQFLSPNFDGCVADLILALLCGGTLVIASTAQLTVGPPLLRSLRDKRINVAILTPSVWLALPDGPLPELRIAAAAGERLPSSVVARWASGHRRFLNLYGPAEAAVWATWHECRDDGTDPPIGRPVANKRVYVLDEELRPVPIGEVGELCIGGKGIGRYLSSPELMSAHFRSDPFVNPTGRLLYRTGDMCRWRHDGSLEYVGRRDRQVKIRGQRVEIEEVERILEAAPGVAACAVVKYEDSLHAVVVPEHGAIDEAKVRRHLEERLYRGIAPVSLLTVDELPHTTNGKIDHGAVEALVASWRMPEPNARDLPSADSEYAVTPAAVEDQHSRLLGRIMQIVTSCLQDPYVQVDVESDFFSLGGDSLAIAELLTVIEQEFGVILESDDLVKSPTPAFIASYIENHKAGQNALVGRRP